MTSLTKTAALIGSCALWAGAAQATDSDAMTAAQAVIDQYSVIPEFAPLGEPFDAATCMADKRVFSVPITMAIPFVVELTNAMTLAAEDVGFEFTVWANQGGTDAWIQGVNQAVVQGYDLIDITGGLNPAVVGPQLQEARDAGILVTTTHLYDDTQEQADVVDASAKIPFSTAGEILASWAYVQTDGAPNVLIIGSDDVVPTEPFVASIQDTLSEYCPDCEQQYLNVPVAEWATRIQSGVQSALLANPDINYILPIYDSMSQFVVPALRIAGSTDVEIASFNGTPFVLDMVREGTVTMNIGESLGWAGYAAVDALMRTACGMDVPESLGIPLLIFDESNIETAGVPADFDSGYGDAHIDGYRALWGLQE